MKKLLLITLLSLLAFSCATPGYGIYYKIESAQSFSDISAKCGIPENELKKANNIPETELPLDGETIFIPGISELSECKNPVPAKPAPAPEVTPVETVKLSEDEIISKFIWPVKGVVVTVFGKSGNTKNDGIDIAIPADSPVSAAADGKILFAENHGGFGNTIIIEHSEGFITVYAHNNILKVKSGDLVKKGDIIALSGMTGSAKIPYLHFEIRQGSEPLDPKKYLPQN